ncbi:hypothetical protein IAG44_37245 [Streptomyces roseirectus]|uniref:Uncharacterized protein n=1 Tax=Streptomyces roseirectus TaxID=2768066 RepID=A0A7H0IP32_9ACTN|nr:hypothetical protein [Streptomyces roseirectus]QNP74548.1 hypothetical protein IAG44_37245 [Streptomyces roseirectus]
MTAAGILTPDGDTFLPADDEATRSLAVLERRFGLSLSPAVLRDARLPAHTLVRVSG